MLVNMTPSDKKIKFKLFQILLHKKTNSIFRLYYPASIIPLQLQDCARSREMSSNQIQIEQIT